MNYFNIDQVELWRCNIDSISEGILRLRVAPIALSRIDLDRVLWCFVSINAYRLVRCCFFLAPHEECLELIRSLRQENLTRQIIDENEYKLFATRSTEVRILAKDSLKIISQR